MRGLTISSSTTALLVGLVFVLVAGPVLAQQGSSSSYPVGSPLGVPIGPDSRDVHEPISSNVSVYGAIYSAESCTYDTNRDVLVVPNRGAPQSVQANDAWISFINSDGSVHTPRWLGIQSPSERSELSPPLTLNHPLGSDIAGRTLYLADRDGGTGPNDPSVSVIRWFDLETGTPEGELPIEGSPWINDIEVAENGTIYVTQTGDIGPNADPSTWRVWEVSPDGSSSVFAQGEPLDRPNGIGLDAEGRIVVVNYGNSDVLTFSRDGEHVQTEQAAQPGSDGLVIMDDGTKYVSSVQRGGVSRIPPGGSAELIAENIPSAASMCYDPAGNQLVIPMNPNSGLAFVPLE